MSKKKNLETSGDLLKAMTNVYATAFKQPNAVWQAYTGMLEDMAKSFVGQSDVTPEKGDKRFLDPIWSSNPAYRALMQSYLSWANNLETWIEALDIPERDRLRAKVLTGLIADSLAPTNTLLGNPAAMKTTLEHGGKNLVAGAKHFIEDMVNNNGLPSMVDKSKFAIGENLALSKGQVVYREDMLELVQYEPTQPTVHKRPMFLIPPQINKYYVWDLAPGKSIIEYLLSKGHQVFIVSWRNPGEDQSHWDMEAYVQALDRATEVACDISKSPDMNFVGACSGGTTATLLLAYWASKGVERANSFSLMVAILDTDGAKDTTMGLFANLETLEIASMFSRSKGLVAGSDLQKAFAWLRPNDLIWAYWVNNYLLGNEPPAFDILFWNADTTNLPGAFHADLMDLMAQGGLTEGRTWRIGEHDVDMGNITCDTYIVGGTTDHITPWDGCYMSVKNFGGKSDFVLSESGHVQAMINPPGNPKARYLLNTGDHSSPDEFLDGAERHEGTWWDHWSVWLAERGDDRVKAPKSVGSRKYPAMENAPGTYVLEGKRA